MRVILIKYMYFNKAEERSNFLDENSTKEEITESYLQFTKS